MLTNRARAIAQDVADHERQMQIVNEAAKKKRRHTMRRFKDGRYVLEFDARGNMAVRAAHSRKRFPTSLQMIYESAVKRSVMLARLDKARAKKKGKR